MKFRQNLGKQELLNVAEDHITVLFRLITQLIGNMLNTPDPSACFFFRHVLRQVTLKAEVTLMSLQTHL